MASRTLPGLGLNGFWLLGEDGWKTGADANWLTLSVLVQGKAISRVTALPGSPTDGDIYIVPSGAGSNANEIAIRDDGAWVYIVPVEGDRFYVTDSEENVQFDGAAWQDTDGSSAVPFEIEVALSDMTTNLTTGTAKADFFAPMDATITEVFIGIGTVSSSGAVTFDLNKAGATMFSTNPSIVAGERTNLTGGGTAAVLSTTTWTKGDYMTVDFDAVGTGAKAAKMVIRGTR